MLQRIAEPTLPARSLALTPTLVVHESCGAYPTGGGRQPPFQEPPLSIMRNMLQNSILRILGILAISAWFLVREQVQKELETPNQIA